MIHRRTIVTTGSLLSAVVIGLTLAGLSQLGAVDVNDPRPSGGAPRSDEPPLSSPTATPAPSPPSTATPVAATPSDDTPRVWVHTVESGESISRIAIRFGTTTEEIIQLNPEYADNENLVREGAELILPCTPLAMQEGRCS